MAAEDRIKGYAAAIFEIARGERIAIIDADLQEDPAELPTLLAGLDEDAPSNRYLLEARMGGGLPPLANRRTELSVLSVTGTQHYTFAMDTRAAPFNDNNVRLALKHAIDREELVGAFGAFVFSDEPGCAKPDRRAFEAAAETLGGTEVISSRNRMPWLPCRSASGSIEGIAHSTRSSTRNGMPRRSLGSICDRRMSITGMP